MNKRYLKALDCPTIGFAPGRIALRVGLLALLLASLSLSLPGWPGAAPTQAQTRAPSASQSGAPDQRFGVVEAFEAGNAATALHVGWERVTFSWPQFQPTGTHDFEPGQTSTRRYFNGYFNSHIYNPENAAGRQLVGLLKDTPRWASPSGKITAVPSGLYLPWNDPRNVWGHFASIMAQNYRGKINDWVIWNEPDIWDPSQRGLYTWAGTVADYYQLEKVGYQAIKAANPQAVVHLGGLTYWWDVFYWQQKFHQDVRHDMSKQYFFRFLDVARADPIAAAHNYYFDVATLHLYFSPMDLYYVLSRYHQEMAARGIVKDLWLNEINAPPSLDPHWLRQTTGIHPITLTEQAAFMIESGALALATGAKRVSVYKLADSPNLHYPNESFGLLRPNGSTRPALDAYRAFVSAFSGFETVSASVPASALDPDLHRGVKALIIRINATRNGGGLTTVVWNVGHKATVVTILARHASATLYDELGNARTIRAVRSSHSRKLIYQITLPGFTCPREAIDPDRRACDVEGAPFMLVQ